jgi:hypothetical protein
MKNVPKLLIKSKHTFYIRVIPFPEVVPIVGKNTAELGRP